MYIANCRGKTSSVNDRDRRVTFIWILIYTPKVVKISPRCSTSRRRKLYIHIHTYIHFNCIWILITDINICFNYWQYIFIAIFIDRGLKISMYLHRYFLYQKLISSSASSKIVYNIGDEGAKEIAEALKVNTSLTVTYL